MRFAVTKTSVTTTRGNFLPDNHAFREGTWGPRELVQETEPAVNYKSGYTDMDILTSDDKDKVLTQFGRDQVSTRAARKTAIF